MPYMDPHLPSIYPSHVRIYTIHTDPMGYNVCFGTLEDLLSRQVLRNDSRSFRAKGKSTMAVEPGFGPSFFFALQAWTDKIRVVPAAGCVFQILILFVPTLLWPGII